MSKRQSLEERRQKPQRVSPVTWHFWTRLGMLLYPGLVAHDERELTAGRVIFMKMRMGMRNYPRPRGSGRARRLMYGGGGWRASR